MSPEGYLKKTLSTLCIKIDYRKATLKFFHWSKTTTTQQHINRRTIVDQLLTYHYPIANLQLSSDTK